MGLFRWISGWVRLRYTSADVGSVLSELEKKGIALYDVSAVDEFTLEFSLRRQELKRLRAISKRRGEKLLVTAYRGFYWPLVSLLNRKLLVSGILIALTAGLLLPGRILFIHTEGNLRIPEQRILEAAEQAGLDFGARRRSIRSEQIKNRLLDLIPELKWAGVNTYGSRAVITVRERDDMEEAEKTHPVRHMVASRDGIITSCTVTSGSGTCAVGQAVKEGDILISGYTDCGITIRADAADGQIFAETNRFLRVLTPSVCQMRTDPEDRQVRYSLNLGKKRINFYKGSGISGASCVKMSSEYVLRLPGGFELPVSLVREEIRESHTVTSEVMDSNELLVSFAAAYLEGQMISGTVLRKAESVSDSDGIMILEGRYACIEDIGIAQDEKIGDLHGKTNGADRERRPGG